MLCVIPERCESRSIKVMSGARRIETLNFKEFRKMIIDWIVQLEQALIRKLDNGNGSEQFGNRAQVKNRAVAPIVFVLVVGVAVAESKIGFAPLNDLAAKSQKWLEVHVNQKGRNTVGDRPLGFGNLREKEKKAEYDVDSEK
jgi:hypothetical protein